MPSNSKIILYRWVLVETVTYGRNLVFFIVNHNVNNVVLVLVVTFAGIEESVNRDCFTSESSSSKVCSNPCIYELHPIFLPDSVRSAIMRGPSDRLGELMLIGSTLVLVDCTSKLRLGPLLDENTERNFCFHLFDDCLLLGGVESFDMMARGNLR